MRPPIPRHRKLTAIGLLVLAMAVTLTGHTAHARTRQTTVVTGHAPASFVALADSRAAATSPATKTNPLSASPPGGIPAIAPQADHCSPVDIRCKVVGGINSWFQGLVKDSITTVFDALGTGLLSTPRIDRLARVNQLWSTSLAIADTCFILFVVAGGLVVMGYETFQTSYTVKDVAPRLVIGMAAANLSLLLIGKAIELANALSGALLGPGVDPAQLTKQIEARLGANDPSGSVLVILVILAAEILAVGLSLTYVMRVAITIVLAAAAPLALLCHALPHTEELAKLWWRALTGVLAIQVCQSLVFIAAAKVMFTPTPPIGNGSHWWDVLITLCLLYVLVRIPTWIFFYVWSGGMRRGNLTRLIAYRFMIRNAVRRGYDRRTP
jgi:hypothetical protein